MKEDVLKFIKLCDILIKDKGYNKNRIVIESKISWPTFQKILTTPIEGLHIAASVLGLVQDYNRLHRDDFNYGGIKYEPVILEKELPMPDPETKVKKEKKVKTDNAVKELNLKSKVDISDLVQIVTFLKMEATKHRRLADNFDAVADDLMENANKKQI